MIKTLFRRGNGVYFRELFITGVRKGEEEEGTSLSVFFVVESPPQIPLVFFSVCFK